MKPPRHITGELFLRGPIPWQWLAAAGRLGGKALHVGIYVWYLAGLRNSTQVKLSTRGLQEIGVTRKCAHEALATLERQQLLLLGLRSTSSNCWRHPQMRQRVAGDVRTPAITASRAKAELLSGRGAHSPERAVSGLGNTNAGATFHDTRLVSLLIPKIGR